MKTSVIDIGIQRSNPELVQAISAAFAQSQPELAPNFIVSTTGSTGVVKRVRISTSAIANSAKLSNTALGAKSGDVWSLLLPTHHIAGLNVLARSVLLETKVVGIDKHADFSAIVPTQLYKALNGESELLNHLKNCKAVLVGGAPITNELFNQAIASDINIVTTYGMSETSGGCVYDNVPLAGVEIAISETGLIKIKGPILASGYEDGEALWNQCFSDGWFTTSDLGYLKAGKLFVTGRADDVIISGGENISLTAIESKLSDSFPGVNFLATSIPDPLWGTKLCLLADKEVEQDKIAEVLIPALGKAAVPKDFLEVHEIPQIGIGKPDRVKAAQFFIDKQR
jgi:O-succinylbenzoic acid--CoA ligase